MTIEAPRTSVLAKLTAEVMGEKKTAAAKPRLTPVEGESPPPKFPSDLPGAFMSHEGMRLAAKDLRRHAATMVEIANGLDTLTGETTDPAPPVDLDAIRKQKEAETEARIAASKAVEVDADEAESFADRQKRLADEAQAAVFAGWKCPNHGKAIEKTSSKTNRKFIGCPDCNLFQRS